MTQKIVIENGIASIVEEQVSYRAPINDLTQFLEHKPPFTMFHPRSAIFTQWDESIPGMKRVKFLCELAPGIKNIRKLNRRYRLAMPWTYLLFSFENRSQSNEGHHWSMSEHRVFHSNQRVTGPSSRLWTALLPNVYEDGNICFGTTGANIQQPLADRVDQLVNEWYLSEFNNDVISSRNHPTPEFFPRETGSTMWHINRGLRAWVDATNENGAAAWANFSIWEKTNGEDGATSHTVSEVLALQGLIDINPTVTDTIPEIPQAPTFGAAEEWLMRLTPVQRTRIRGAIATITETEPEETFAPAPDDPTGEEDDGGVPI